MRWLLVAAAVAVSAGLFVALRPEEEEAEAPPTVAATEPAETPTLTTPATTTETEPAGTRRIRVTVVDGRPRGGIVRETVEQGERVVFVVRADVRDRVHLHGYDAMRDVRPGAPAQLAFTADIVGRFDVELEDTHVLIAQLEVLP